MDRNKICRLCAKLCKNQKLTSLDDPFRCIRSKLFRCSQIDITDDNKALPQNVCKDCVESLEHCWNFTETVSAAQTKLQLQFSDDPLSGVKLEEVMIGDEIPTDYDAMDDSDNEITGTHAPRPMLSLPNEFLNSHLEILKCRYRRTRRTNIERNLT